MTAEVAVVNAQGVALAADSAVTIANGKVYNSVEKLFRLSENDPVAMMVYGTGDCCGTPWELVVKQFRRVNETTQFGTVELYALNFISFLEQRKDLIPLNSRAQSTYFLLSNLYQLIFTKLRDTVAALLSKQQGEVKEVTDDDTLPMLCSILDDEIEVLKRSQFRLGLDEHKEAQIADDQNLRSTLLTPAEQNLGNLYQHVCERCLSLSVLYLTRRGNCFNQAGLVFAGYGQEEFAPSVQTYQFIGALGDHCFAEYSEGSSSPPIMGRSTIIPFAQADVVHSFVTGVSPEMHNYLNVKLRESFDGITIKILQQLASANLPQGAYQHIYSVLSEACQEALTTFQSELSSQIQNFSNPMVDMLRFLPKEEMAALAESLVQITALKRKMSNTVETVGGPVDVALVTKSDGFIWIKRKHYFEQELNHHFFK